MAVAAGIVEAHGGALRVWNEPGVGNRFVVDLPFPAVSGAGASAGGAPEIDNAGRQAA
jgi:K+-sensing histidine kinase KdpD